MSQGTCPYDGKCAACSGLLCQLLSQQCLHARNPVIHKRPPNLILCYCSHYVINPFNECIQIKRINFKSTVERGKPQITLGVPTVCISDIYASESYFAMGCSESKTMSKSKIQVWRGSGSTGCPVTPC